MFVRVKLLKYIVIDHNFVTSFCDLYTDNRFIEYRNIHGDVLQGFSFQMVENLQRINFSYID